MKHIITAGMHHHQGSLPTDLSLSVAFHILSPGRQDAVLFYAYPLLNKLSTFSA